MFGPSASVSDTSTKWDEHSCGSISPEEEEETHLYDYFNGPQLLITATGGKVVSLEPDAAQSGSVNAPLISMHIFHGADTQQWLIHDNGYGGAAVMSRSDGLYVVPSATGDIDLDRAPYFWSISKDGDMYRFSMKRGHDEQLFLENKYAKLSSQRDSTTLFTIVPITAAKNQVTLKTRFTKLAMSTNSDQLDEDLKSSPSSPCNQQEFRPAPMFGLTLKGLACSSGRITGRECTGFPTGFFRIRSAEKRDPPQYWTVHHEESTRDGNILTISQVKEQSDAQAFYINANGELCVSGVHVDIFGNCLIVAKMRVPTFPWPNPWSHHLPTFTYSEESKTITVKPYIDPLISGGWPRPSKDWQDKEYIVTAKCTSGVRTPDVNSIARWTPTYRFIRWTGRSDYWREKHDHSLGLEEFKTLKPGSLLKDAVNPRMQWEIEQFGRYKDMQWR